MPVEVPRLGIPAGQKVVRPGAALGTEVWKLTSPEPGKSRGPVSAFSFQVMWPHMRPGACPASSNRGKPGPRRDCSESSERHLGRGMCAEPFLFDSLPQKLNSEKEIKT